MIGTFSQKPKHVARNKADANLVVTTVCISFLLFIYHKGISLVKK
jgi:hypothetical protein